MHRNRVTLVLLASALTLALGALVPAPAAAQGQKGPDRRERIPILWTGVDNPCTPEFDDITLQGELRIFQTYFLLPDGGYRYMTRLNLHLRGADAAGRGYLVNEEFKDDHSSRSTLYVSRLRSRLISQGSVPNFHFAWVYTFDFVTLVETLTLEKVDCRG